MQEKVLPSADRSVRELILFSFVLLSLPGAIASVQKRLSHR